MGILGGVAAVLCAAAIILHRHDHRAVLARLLMSRTERMLAKYDELVAARARAEFLLVCTVVGEHGFHFRLYLQ